MPSVAKNKKPTKTQPNKRNNAEALDGTQRHWTGRSLRTLLFEVRSLDPHQHHLGAYQKSSVPRPSQTESGVLFEEFSRSLENFPSAHIYFNSLPGANGETGVQRGRWICPDHTAGPGRVSGQGLRQNLVTQAPVRVSFYPESHNISET